MKKILLVLFYFVPCVCCAQLTEKINRHFVIAIDGAPAAPYISCLREEDVSRKAIEKALAEFNVTDKDRVSLVSFAVSLSYPDFKSFAYIPNGEKGGRLYYKKISGADLSSWGNWENIVVPSGVIGHLDNHPAVPWQYPWRKEINMPERNTVTITNDQEYLDYLEGLGEYLETQSDAWFDLHDTNIWD